jgi:peptide/nickel transport system permease protein
MKGSRLIGLALVFLLILSLLVALGWMATDFETQNETLSYGAPSLRHPLGNDVFGRNILSRALYGLWIAIQIGTVSSAVATALGVFFGSLAGYKGGFIARSVEWLYSSLDSIPYLLLLAAFRYALGPGLQNAYIALGLTAWVPLCRMLQVEVQRLKFTDFVLSARALGFDSLSILIRHILPNTFHLILTHFLLTFILAVKIEVLLSYLGLGVQIGTPSWGLMIDDAKSEWARGFWWNMIAATGFLFALVFSLTWTVERWRHRLDPRHLQRSVL